MEFIPLENMAIFQRMLALKAGQNAKDKSGTTVWCNWNDNVTVVLGWFPFFSASTTTYESTTGINALFAAASSDIAISHNAYNVSNKVGTATIQRTDTSKGANFVITVTGNEGDQINSIFFGKNVYRDWNYGTTSAFLLFAVKLDNTVTIDSTGTASFILSIELA